MKTKNKCKGIMKKEENTLWNIKDSFIRGTSEHIQRKVEKGNLFLIYLEN